MLQLSDKDQAMLSGDFGPAVQMAMQIISTMAGAYDAQQLLDIESAHIDGCLYHGDSGIDFAERLLEGGARVVVPATLNVGAIDLLHPEDFRGSAEQAAKAQRLMAMYQEMGCQPLWTCAPYQAAQRPAFGAQIAWAESNAIVFANSVLGARTNRYGDFIDICAAITGRAPAAGLHLSENRCGQIFFDLVGIPERLLNDAVLYPVLGYIIGERSGNQIPGEKIVVDLEMLKDKLGSMSTVPDGKIDVVALGSPHYSLAEFDTLLKLLADSTLDTAVQFIVCTNRLALIELKKRGWLEILDSAGVRVVVDTCVVVAPIARVQGGVLMTNSGKFAHYAPGNIGLQVVFGSLEECLRSAEIGRVWRDSRLWDS